jgi:hypothetical protein
LSLLEKAIALSYSRPTSMQPWSDDIQRHWPEYLVEGAGLGLFMISAAVVTAAFEYPHSPLHDLISIILR